MTAFSLVDKSLFQKTSQANIQCYLVSNNRSICLFENNKNNQNHRIATFLRTVFVLSLIAVIITVKLQCVGILSFGVLMWVCIHSTKCRAPTELFRVTLITLQLRLKLVYLCWDVNDSLDSVY